MKWWRRKRRTAAVSDPRLAERLAATRAWHGELAAWGGKMTPGRSPGLRPEQLPRDLYWRDFALDESVRRVEEIAVLRACVQLAEAVVGRREQLLDTRKKPAGKPASGGRVAIFHPHQTTALELSRIASGDVVDEYDEVGWDWWLGVHRYRADGEIGFGSSGLVAWIPPELDEAVDAGITANTDGSLAWIDIDEVELMRPDDPRLQPPR